MNENFPMPPCKFGPADKPSAWRAIPVPFYTTFLIACAMYRYRVIKTLEFFLFCCLAIIKAK